MTSATKLEAIIKITDDYTGMLARVGSGYAISITMAAMAESEVNIPEDPTSEENMKSVSDALIYRIKGVLDENM